MADKDAETPILLPAGLLDDIDELTEEIGESSSAARCDEVEQYINGVREVAKADARLSGFEQAMDTMREIRDARLVGE